LLLALASIYLARTEWGTPFSTVSLLLRVYSLQQKRFYRIVAQKSRVFFHYSVFARYIT
jgi:hypothetical protein